MDRKKKYWINVCFVNFDRILKFIYEIINVFFFYYFGILDL